MHILIIYFIGLMNMKIEMKNIMKYFGTVKVLNNASFSLDDG